MNVYVRDIDETLILLVTVVDEHLNDLEDHERGIIRLSASKQR